MSIPLVLPINDVENYANSSLDALIVEFQRLDQVLDHYEHEVKKLIILQTIENQLNRLFGYPEAGAKIEGPKYSIYQQNFIKFSYQVCMVFGFFEKAAGSYLFGSNLFAEIPGIDPLSLFVLTSIYILIDAFLFYTFEVTLLKKVFGITADENQACILNEIYSQQLNATTAINQLLHDRATMRWKPKTYERYCQGMIVFNAHLIKKNNSMQSYQSSVFRTGLEYGLVIFGGITSIADGFFMAKNALLLLRLSWLSSPFGGLLVVGILVSALVFYYAMSVNNMSNLVYPDRQSYHNLKDGLTLFGQKFGSRSPYQPKQYNAAHLLFPPVVELQSGEISRRNSCSF